MNKKTKSILGAFFLIFIMLTYAAPFAALAADVEAPAAVEITEDAAIAEPIAEVSDESEEVAAAEEVAEETEETEETSKYYATWLSLLPPVIAIVLALITKEVYSSLFIGVLSGALIYTNFNIIGTIESIFSIMTSKISDNLGIVIFLVILGIMVSVMNKAGGSAAYGKWASQKIKSKTGATLSTVALGVLIFVDDYFNCLTVGSVMKPVTDKFKMSRAKLAYIIDATAAPVCIIAPISSWAAAVASSTEGTAIDGFAMFIQAIPYNYYALLTIIMLIALAVMKFDFGPMKKVETLAAEGDLFGGLKPEVQESAVVSPKGRVCDLVVPVIVLIIGCICGMLYTGGILDGATITDAFANCDAATGLMLGSFVSLVITFVFYMIRRVISFKEFTNSIPEGFKAMIAPILILTFAWTLSGFCRDCLGAGSFVKTLVESHAAASLMLPAIMFLIALGLSFATGTSWGTFGILIPIVLAIFPEMQEILVISISACLAGAVCGDHISPISDTTIMASAGAECNHISHVSTQIPYAMVVAAISFVGYILAGLIQNAWIVLPIEIAILLVTLFVIKKVASK